MTFRRQWSASNLAERFDFLTFGKIGWGFLGILLLICFLGYILIIKEIKIIFMGPIPWIAIITQTGKSYLSFFMDLTNDFLHLLNLNPIFEGKITNIMIALGNAAIITLYISIVSFILGFLIALLLAVILVTQKTVLEKIIGTLLWSIVLSFIFVIFIQYFSTLPLIGWIIPIQIGFLKQFGIVINFGDIFGILLGILLGINIGRKSGLKSLTRAYIDFFRSTPLLVQMFIVYFGFPTVFTGPEFVFVFQSTSYEIYAAIIALGLNTAAYQAEIVRSGILAIPIGQTEASRGLGFSTRQTMQYIIVPQALRMIIPPLTNEGINVILNSSIASVISARELIRSAGFLVIAYFDPFLIFGIAAVFYFVMAFSLAKLTMRMEKKYRIPGLGVVHD